MADCDVPQESLARIEKRKKTPRGCSLPCMHQTCIVMHMRTTLNLDSGLIDRAKELTGIREKTALVHAGLEALLAREAARRLAALGGAAPDSAKKAAAAKVSLADTSVWMAHFRAAHPKLQRILIGNQLVTHPFVVGELACGNLPQRLAVLKFLRLLPSVPLRAMTKSWI